MARELHPIIEVLKRLFVQPDPIAECTDKPLSVVDGWFDGAHVPKKHLPAIEQFARQRLEECCDSTGRLIVRYPHLRTDEAFRAWLQDLNYAHWVLHGTGFGQEVKK